MPTAKSVAVPVSAKTMETAKAQSLASVGVRISNMNQEQALEVLKSGGNVFLTGEAGTGKSYTVSQFVKWLKENGRRYAITATTGIAASHINGVTIHSWIGMGIKRNLKEDQVRFIKNNQWIAEKIRETRVLIIDEISMLDAVALTDVDKILRAVLDKDRAFGGMQMVFVGDFFQLPPVVTGNEERHFAFEAEAWELASLNVCYLTEQHRQTEGKFLEILSGIRHQHITEEHLQILSQCQMQQIPETKLFTHNVDVDALNERKLSEIEEKEYTYTMRSGGNEHLVQTLKRQCLSPEILTLKKRAVVMFTRNNFDKGYVNGTTGKVVDFQHGLPLVELKNGQKVVPDEAEWKLESRRGNEGWIKQIPLKLAWAITVHKSQGMSLDTAAIDLSKVFEYGQGYVAISRMVSLDGLHLTGVSEDVFKMHPTVIEQDLIFQEMSGKPVVRDTLNFDEPREDPAFSIPF